MPAARRAAGTLQHRSLICPSLVRSSRTGSSRTGTPRTGSPRTGSTGTGTSRTGSTGTGTPRIGTPRIGSSRTGTPSDPDADPSLDTTIRSAPDDTFDSDAPLDPTFDNQATFDAYRADPAQHSWLHATDTQLHRQLPTAKQQRDSSRQIDINGSLYPTEQCRRSKLYNHAQRRSPIDHDSHPEQQQWQSHHHGAHAKSADQQHAQPLYTDALHQ